VKLYLFVDTKVICKWCDKPLMQIVEGDPTNVLVRLCPACDSWPPNFMGRKNDGSL
jgi:hypothetical protein